MSAPLMHRLQHRRDLGTVAGLVLLSLTLWAATPHFATVDNLLNVAEQSAVVGVLAVGMTFVILTGGIDLSVGSLAALCGIVAALVLRSSASVPLAVLSGVGTGVVAGALNGLLVTAGRLPPFIATLGMMSAARGGALMLADGRPISGFPDGLRALASARWVGVPFPIIALLALVGLAHLVLSRTVFGRHLYAIGGNEEAASLSGITVARHKVVVYAIAGASAAACALLLMARLNSAQPIAGIGYELDAIAAVVIGGTSLLGGAGTVGGTLAGALIMSVLRNGLTLLGVSSYVQQVAIGVVIVAAVLVDMALRRRVERRTV